MTLSSIPLYACTLPSGACQDLQLGGIAPGGSCGQDEYFNVRIARVKDSKTNVTRGFMERAIGIEIKLPLISRLLIKA